METGKGRMKGEEGELGLAAEWKLEEALASMVVELLKLVRVVEFLGCLLGALEESAVMKSPICCCQR
jgi:hypothetical protein